MYYNIIHMGYIGFDDDRRCDERRRILNIFKTCLSTIGHMLGISRSAYRGIQRGIWVVFE